MTAMLRRMLGATVQGVKARDLAALIDGRLSERQDKQIRKRIAADPTLQRMVLGMEQSKILLKEAPRVAPHMDLDARVLEAVAEAPEPIRPWALPWLVGLDAVWEALATLPRAVPTMGLSGLLACAMVVTVWSVTQQRVLRVVDLEGSLMQISEGVRTPLGPGDRIRVREPLETGPEGAVTIRRPDLFTLQLDPQTTIMVDQFSTVGGFGRNNVILQEGAVLFQTESLLAPGDLAIMTSWFTILHQHTIALVESHRDGALLIGVLKGAVALHATERLTPPPAGPTIVHSLQVIRFHPDAGLGVPQPIDQDILERLLEFVPGERLVLLGLPQEHRAAALIGEDPAGVALAFFHIAEPNRRATMMQAHEAFQRGDTFALGRAVADLKQLAGTYQQEGRPDISGPLSLFVASIYAYVDEPAAMMEILQGIANEAGYSQDTRALARCALGIALERQGRLTDARRAYDTVLRKFPTTSVVREAAERLNQLRLSPP